jgi:hypothetical protein
LARGRYVGRDYLLGNSSVICRNILTCIRKWLKSPLHIQIEEEKKRKKEGEIENETEKETETLNGIEIELIPKKL